MSVNLFAFWVFAGVAVGSALLCITRRSPVASADVLQHDAKVAGNVLQKLS